MYSARVRPECTRRYGTLASLAGRTNASAPTQSILPRTWRNQRYIHRLELELRFVRVRSEICFCSLQPVLVVAVGEVGFVMGAAGLVAHTRTLRDHAGQLQHVVKLPRENYCRVRPLRAIAQVDLAIALEE